MKKYQGIGLLIVAVVILVSCGGGDNDSSPTGPSITAISSNVSGTWLFTGNITSNTCVHLQTDPLFQIGNSGTETDEIIQNNASLSASNIAGNIFSSTIRFTGTLVKNTLKLSVSNPTSGTNGTCSYSIGGGTENTLVDETSGNGTVTITLAAVSGNCTIFGTLPCSIIHTGTWRKISSGTGQPNPTPIPTTPTTQPTPIPTTANPTPVPTTALPPTPEPTVIVPTPTPTSNSSCSPRKNCTEMSSCDEAYYYLNVCGDGRLDSDNDGIPCESTVCGG